MIGVSFEHTSVSHFGRLVLDNVSEMPPPLERGTNIFLLLMNVTNLKPYVLLCQRPRRVGDYIFEALRRLAADITKSEEPFLTSKL